MTRNDICDIHDESPVDAASRWCTVATLHITRVAGRQVKCEVRGKWKHLGVKN